VAQQSVEKTLTTQLRTLLPKAVAEGVRENFASGVLPAFEKATQVCVCVCVCVLSVCIVYMRVCACVYMFACVHVCE
jgi:hypothetical protein